jgi:glycosyltransferase involved in cell wall biosynthesis
MRILMVTAGPIDATSGASQIAMNLARALVGLGHEALVFGVEVPSNGLPGVRQRQLQIQAIADRACAHGPFDAIDVPPTLASPVLRGGGLVVVRSVQPELRYLAVEARGLVARAGRGSLRAAWSLLGLAARRRWVGCGWRSAGLILCLGTRELEWMRARPELAGRRMACYWAAPSAEERPLLAEVRRERRGREGSGVKFLWLGRWSAHKGTARLERFVRQRLAGHAQDTLTIAGCGIPPDVAWPEPIRGRIRQRLSFRRDELAPLLAEHDFGLFTSEAEGWGLSVQEMLESGMPVLATQEGAVPDLAPYFPGAIHAFPPGPEWRPGIGRVEPSAGYEARFDWAAIANAYSDALRWAGARHR